MKQCAFCDFRTDHPSAQRCQVCGGAIAPTLPAPAEPVVSHDSHAVETGHARYAIDSGEPPKGPWQLVTDNGIGLVVAFLVVMMLGLVAGEWFMTALLGPPVAADSTGRVRVGMHVSELVGLRGVTPGDPVLAPGSTASGTIVLDADNRVIRIHFTRGLVTSVEEGTSNSGDTATFKMIANE